MTVRVAFALVIGLAGSAAAQVVDVPADTLIHMQRTSCFGPCPIYAVTIDARGTVTPVQDQAEGIVQELRQLPAPLPGMARSDGTIDPIEQRRGELYGQLRQLGPDALPALAQGLKDPDIQLRKNVPLALNMLAGDGFDRSKPKMDIRAALSALITALQDSDGNVRAWSAQAIGEIGPDAARAVPALIALLRSEDDGSRNSACIALYGIGPAAKEALPALQKALSDPSPDVRRFAQRAVDKIRTP